MNKNSKKNLQELEEPTSSTNAKGFRELDIAAMERGIGRKAADEELLDYLSKGQDTEPIDIETAFSKYTY